MKILYKIFFIGLLFAIASVSSANNVLVPNPFSSPATPDNKAARSLDSIIGKPVIIQSPEQVNRDIAHIKAARDEEAEQQQQQALKTNKNQLTEQATIAEKNASKHSAPASTEPAAPPPATAFTPPAPPGNNVGNADNNSGGDGKNSSSTASSSGTNEWGIQY